MTNIFNIPAYYPFLDSLIKGIIEKYGTDPLTLCKITILLPNRRSCRALTNAFLKFFNNKAMLLPKILPIGDIDEEELSINLSAQGISHNFPNIISPLNQKIILAKLIKKLKGDEILFSQCLNLATQLALLLSDTEREQLSIADIEHIIPEELARHWQINLDFLRILMDNWPQILKEHDAISPVNYRNMLHELKAKSWQKNPPKYSVIAAGSTGSVPATAKLLQTIAQLENGMVVLPGFDYDKNLHKQQELSENHPQYSMLKLIHALNADPNNIKNWHGCTPYSHHRTALINNITYPDNSANWHSTIININAFKNIEKIECDTIWQEAEVICLIMRYHLEKQDETTALITNERKLARIVAAKLQKWHIDIDDSAGFDITNLPCTIFFLQIADFFTNLDSPITLLALLKHPLSCFGQSAEFFKKIIYKMELASLHGIRPQNGINTIVEILKMEKNVNKTVYEITHKLAKLVNKIEEIFKSRIYDFTSLLEKHIEFAEILAASNNKTGQQRLWHNEHGKELRDLLDDIMQSPINLGNINTSDYSGIIKNMLTGKTIRPKYGKHPRLHILSPMEARLQQFDNVIIGHFNEGAWPQISSSDPWMNRPMRKDFGLPLPERRTGLLAHDLAGLLFNKQIYITRTNKISGAQTMPSRWLMKMEAIMAISNQQSVLTPTKPWLEAVKSFYKSPNTSPITRPLVKPPVHTRPTTLSVTSIEKLMHDPYVIYASKILKLKKLDDIDKEPGHLEFGNIVHNILDIYMQNLKKEKSKPDYDKLMTTIHSVLQNNKQIKPSILSFWLPKLSVIAKWFIINEKTRYKNYKDILIENWGKYQFSCNGHSFTLSAKADRIEINHDDTINIIDYKTGKPPTSNEVIMGLSPQITLEAVIAKNGGYEQIPQNSKINTLAFWELKGGIEKSKIHLCKPKEKTKNLENIITETQQQLEKIITLFFNENTPYIACPDENNTLKYNDYSHLERIKEWS